MTDPFTNPAPRGLPPYWLRPRDLQLERQHRRLMDLQRCNWLVAHDTKAPPSKAPSAE